MSTIGVERWRSPLPDADTARVTPFVLPVTIRTPGSSDIDLLVDLTGPTCFAVVAPDLLLRAGLPATTVLNLGAGPVEDSWMLGRAPLLAGTLLSTVPDDAATALGAVNLSCVAGPDAGRSVPLGAEPVVIGRSPSCDLMLDDPELSRRHATITWSVDGLHITDLHSMNGVLVDGVGRSRSGSGGPLARGALIRLGASVLRATLDSEPAVILTPDGAGHLAVARPARIAPPFEHAVSPGPGPTPEFDRRPIPIMVAVIGAAAGTGIAVVTGMMSFLLLAALGPIMMVAGGWSNRINGRRSHRRALADHRSALLAEDAGLREAVVADRLDAWDRYPDPATLLRRASQCSTRLWERFRGDPDFLRLSVGVGSRAARVLRAHPPDVDDVPITVDLGAIGVLGLAGECRPLLRQLIAQLVTLHSPADLRVVVFSDQIDLARIRDFPHLGTDGRPGVMQTTTSAPAAVADLLGPVGADPHDCPTPISVVLLDGAHRWRRTARMNELLAMAAEGNTAPTGIGEHITSPPISTVRRARPAGRRLVVICIATSAEALPVECAAVATVRAGRVSIQGGRHAVDAEAVGVSTEYLDRLVLALSPLADPDTPGTGLPQQLLLSSLLGVQRSAGRFDNRWRTPSLTAVIGVGPAGAVTVDLERDGPHLLIAGTTGSGKSELLQTMIAGLAASAPPDRTALLLVDYKGGAAFGRLAQLPHTTGVVTDLDKTLSMRALSSLRAEVGRRERILADAQVSDLIALRARCGSGAPPSLVIVVDEFATLGAELPDFLNGLLDIAQRGRSLGLHLVLATQRPAGVLSPAMKANIGLRICLRVTDDADSLDVIDTVEAARLPADLPGRAFLRSERSRTQLFQVARVTGTTRVGHRVRLRDAGDVDDPAGESVGISARAGVGTSVRTDLDELVEAAIAAAAHIVLPARPWLLPLPVCYEPDDDHVIGLIDEPSEQCQTVWAAPSGSVMVLGPPRSGRSCALRRFGWAASALGADLLVVDPGGALADLARWPATLTHLDGYDPALIARLVVRLAGEVRSRTATSRPPILLLIDNWEMISGPLDALDYGATLSSIADLAARGPAVGIRVVVAGDLRLQHHRSSSSFTTLLRLSVDQRGESVEAVPGRGRLGSLEIQCASSPGDRPPPARTRPSSGSDEGRCGIVVRDLPMFLVTEDLPTATPNAVPIGVGGDDAGPLSVDLTGPGGGLLIAGPRRSGVSTALRGLAAGAAAAGVQVVRGCLQAAIAIPEVRDVDLRAGVDELHHLLIDHHGPILLIADDVDTWLPEGAVLLEKFLTVAGPGQYLALGTRLDRAMRVQRGPIAEVAALRTGVLLQADAADGGLLDAVLPRRRGQLRPGRGHLVLAGRALPLQVAVPGPWTSPS